MLLEPLAPIALILLLGSIVQGAVGFAYTLVAMPLLAWFGLDLVSIVTLILISVWVQTTVGVVSLREHVRWLLVGKVTGLRLLAMPLGLAALATIAAQDQDVVRRFVGLMVLALVALQIFCEPRKGGIWQKPVALVGASLASGFFQGLTAMGGPVLINWVVAQGWPARQMRAFTFAVFFATLPIHSAMLYWQHGATMQPALITGVLVAPLTFLGARLGVQLGNRFTRERLKQVILAALALIGFSAVVAP